jgi:SNF2 family DNA or RNA helicase
VVVDGDVPATERSARLERHRAGDARVLVGSIATLGESLNLQYCHEAVRLDRHWNPGVNAQTEDRLYRHGQANTVTLRDLVAKDTVDELRVAPRIKDKESLRKAVFGA